MAVLTVSHDSKMLRLLVSFLYDRPVVNIYHFIKTPYMANKGLWPGAFSASGIVVDSECMETHEEMKTGHLWRYVIYRLSDDLHRIIVDEKGSRDKDFSDFLKSLKQAELLQQCRFATYDVEYQVEDQVKGTLVFVSWILDNVETEQKMLYTSSKDAFLKKLDVGVEMTVTGIADLDYAAMVNKCKESSA